MYTVNNPSCWQVDEEIEKKRKTERLLGAMKLMEQIEEREQVRGVQLYAL